MKGFSTAGKVFFTISAVFGALSFLYFKQAHYWSCAWFAILSVVEFHLAMQNKKEARA